MDEITFYDKDGKACAYSEDGVHIFLFDGKPIAYLYQESIYSFNGFHLGFFIDGWVIDNNGFYVYFTPDARGGPLKPIKQIKPIKHVKQIKPVKTIKQIKPIKSIRVNAWSNNPIF
jgi:hypothetical protein